MKNTIVNTKLGKFEIYNTTNNGTEETLYLCKLGSNNQRLTHNNPKNLMTMVKSQFDFMVRLGAITL